jgi:CubicO group peptidase (beta-lactamase class C family)/polyisoprenoid-binding protein YceI
MRLFLVALACPIAAPALAAPKIFDFKDPKEMSAVSLSLDSALEPMVGYAKGISGTLTFDPQNPSAAKGKLAVDVNTVQFASDGYTATARGYALNGQKYPQLFLTVRKVESVKRVSANEYRGVLLADFTCRGITRPKKLQVSATYWPGRAEERTNGSHQGDLLVVRTAFDVSRREHGISEGIPDDLVGDTVRVGVGVVGIWYAPKPEPPAGPVKRWAVEVEDRDNPELVQAELFGPKDGRKLRFTIGERTLEGNVGEERDGLVRFAIGPNPLIGEAQGEIRTTGSSLAGSIQTKERNIRVHGRTVEAFPAAPKLPERVPAEGFAGLGIVERMRAHSVTGMTVARLRDNKVEEVGAFGFLSAGSEQAVRPDTRFLAGTMGGPCLSVAVFRLAQAGKIDLSKPANAYLGNTPIPKGENGWGDEVTVAHLLMNTSGLTHHKFVGYRPDVPIPTLSQLLQGSDPAQLEPLKVMTKPGTVANVAAVNEALLQAIVENAAGVPFEAAMREWVLNPCGMTSSTYAPRPDLDSPATTALGHYSSGHPMLNRVHVYPTAGDSGLWTTAPDMARFLGEMAKVLRGLLNALVTDFALLKTVQSEEQTLGMRRGKDGTFFRGGDPYGFYGQFWITPEQGSGVVVLQNRMMSWRLANEVRDLVAAAGGQK